MAKKQATEPTFEDSLKELETIVERMESGELSLEDSLTAFERGTLLSKRCQQALDAAGKRVEILTARSVDAATEPFDEPE